MKGCQLMEQNQWLGQAHTEQTHTREGQNCDALPGVGAGHIGWAAVRAEGRQASGASQEQSPPVPAAVVATASKRVCVAPPKSLEKREQVAQIAATRARPWGPGKM